MSRLGLGFACSAGIIGGGGGIDANTISLLHADGANASMSIPCSAPSPRTWAAGGNAQLSTAQAKFGASSVLFDGAGDYITSDGNAAYGVGTGALTVDLWLRPNSVAAIYIFDFRPSGGAGSNLYCIIMSGVVQVGYNGSTAFTSGATTIPTGVWTHLAFVRSGSTMTLYVNGVSAGSAACSTSFTNATSRPVFGTAYDLGSGAYNGYMDEIRISNVARWTTGFTPPAAPYS
jgi:hypothetical protein